MDAFVGLHEPLHIEPSTQSKGSIGAMKRFKSGTLAATVALALITFALAGCSNQSAQADCQQVIDFKQSLSDKADAYWEEDHPSNGGNADYSRSEALIIEADQLVVDNPSCFSTDDVSLAAGRLGVNVPESSNSEPQQAQSSSIFDEPAQSYMLASGINSLLAVWGIPLNDENGPRTLGDVSDDILYYLNANAGGSGDITQDDLLLSLQPGNALHSMVNRLFVNQDVIDAVVERWLSYLA